ncbi:MAG: LUD domain-containing protein [Hyphomicrobiales bacterium]|nr:LUD domain-containing protein [Hyphomicrobiales bacterium]
MSGREAILGKVRKSLGGGPNDAARMVAVEARLAKAPKGVIPERGQLDEKARRKLFVAMAERVSATVRQVKSYDDVPKAVAEYLRSRNLPAAIRVGADKRLAKMPWATQKALSIKHGASDGDDEAGVSHAFGAIAESGTLALTSGGDNPTTINFLPEHHIVVLDAKDVAGDMETVLAKVRRQFGKGEMPRTLNFITGPSRSGDIEQKLLLGAHGPRALHIIMVGG